MMNNFKTTLIAFATTLLLIQGCDSMLDIDPKQSIDQSEALTNSDNVQSVLIGSYNQIGSSSLYGGWYQTTADFLASSGEFSFSGTFFQPREIIQKNILYDNSYVANTWIESNEGINIINNVMSGLDLVDDENRARVEGEARLLRGMLYFELIRFFGAQYEAGQTNNQPGVPIILTPTAEINDEANVSRATVEEVYAQILEDMTQAKSLLSDENPVEQYYVNSMVASAMLSRVYLQQGNYALARDEASRVIESGLYQLRPTFAAVFNQSENTTEDIFAMQNTAQSGTNSFFTFYSADSRGDIDISQAHLDEYEAGDARLEMFYTDPGDGATRSGKWNRPTDDQVNVIRLAEMYLTRAETNFRLGESVGDAPLNDLNLIRDRVTLPALSESELTLGAILLERKLELMFEGNLLHDIKRTQGDVGSLPYNDPKLILPLPERDLLVNPNLCQNPSYQGTQC